jgi:hypothetical protein
MPRTTSASVIAICPLKEIGDDLTPFIEVANSIVTAVCVNTESNYSDSQLELIERWLSAHFYSIMRNQQKFRSAGKVQEALDSKVDLLLDQTRYGQTAKLVDYIGNLAALDNTLKDVKTKLPAGTYDIMVSWLGRED